MNFKLIILFLSLFISSQSLLAQDTFLLTGTVNDDTGLPVPGANVFVKGSN